VFYLIVPATPLGSGRAAAHERLEAVIQRLRGAGLHVDGRVADADPVVAVNEAWDPVRFDAIVVSTLPMRVSKWLHVGLPERIAQLTGAPVMHIVCKPPTAPTETEPARPHLSSTLGPLLVLGWARRTSDSASRWDVRTKPRRDPASQPHTPIRGARRGSRSAPAARADG